MAIAFLDLPFEIRTMLYHELFKSSPIVCHQNLEIWDSSDEESECDSDNPETKKIPFEGDPDESHEMHSPAVLSRGENTCLAILRTCHKVYQEAQNVLYAQTMFIIEHRVGHCINQPGFEIDHRIQHLTIEQEPNLELWSGTNLFLQRHFGDGDAALCELIVSGDGFEEDDEQELEQFLRTTLPQVERLSFVMSIYGGTHMETVDNYSRVLFPDRTCLIEISPHQETVVIRSAQDSDLRRIRRRLRDTQAVPYPKASFQWLKQLDLPDMWYPTSLPARIGMVRSSLSTASDESASEERLSDQSMSDDSMPGMEGEEIV